MKVFSTTKKSLKKNEISSTKIKKQKNFKKTSENSEEKISNKNTRKIEKQQNLINFLFVQLIYFHTLNSILFQLLKHENLYFSTNSQKYITESTLSNNSEFQVKKYLIAEKQEVFLIFTTKFIQFLSSQSYFSMNIQLTVHYIILFLMFRTSEALYFKKSDIIKFVKHFKNLEKNHKISE